MPATTELEGKWISSSDNHPIGTTCGLDVSGNHGLRQTITFTNNQYTYVSENCFILAGNTGSYVVSSTVTGQFAIGGVSLTSADPASQMRALDLMSTTTTYTSYNLAGNTLHIAMSFQLFDGSTVDKRAFQTASFVDSVTHKLVTNPPFTKQ